MVSTPWVQVAITCCASAAGSLMIFADMIYNFFAQQSFSILESNMFLGIALSLSAGTLLITAINALLPKSVSYILAGAQALGAKQTNLVVALMFVTGGGCCYLFNFIVLKLTSDSVLGCAHDHEMLNKPVKLPTHSHSLASEHAPLLGPNVLTHGSAVQHPSPSTDPCSSDEASPRADSDGTDEIASRDPHFHKRFSRHHEKTNAGMLSIGLQTTVGIAVHRIPEGLLLFATSHTDKQLGLSLVLALSFHSFSEGFSIAAPLYKALGNRMQVIFIALLLGSGPQALGAYIGSLIFHGSDSLSPKSQLNFGLAIGATAGFMTVLALQMASVAFTYMSRKAAINGVFAGCVISLLSRSL